MDKSENIMHIGFKLAFFFFFVKKSPLITKRWARINVYNVQIISWYKEIFELEGKDTKMETLRPSGDMECQEKQDQEFTNAWTKSKILETGPHANSLTSLKWWLPLCNGTEFFIPCPYNVNQTISHWIFMNSGPWDWISSACHGCTEVDSWLSTRKAGVDIHCWEGWQKEGRIIGKGIRGIGSRGVRRPQCGALTCQMLTISKNERWCHAFSRVIGHPGMEAQKSSCPISFPIMQCRP